jgi:Ni/Co efflux regulator RcnB
MPPAYTGGAMVDPRAYHLRRPPIGYGWVVVGPNAYLLQRSSGMILDTAPLY